MKKYGAFLQNERKARNISQAELAKAIGVSQVAIHYFESDKNEPRIGIIEKIADFYGITVDELIGHEVKKNWE